MCSYWFFERRNQARQIVSPAGTSTDSSTLNADVQFSPNRHAVLFSPGTYTGVEAAVGYYKSVAALGETPSAVHINIGYLNSNQTGANGKITTNFWRTVILDNIWAWRADHGTEATWTGNVAMHGLIVNGDNVTALELAVEHLEAEY